MTQDFSAESFKALVRIFKSELQASCFEIQCRNDYSPEPAYTHGPNLKENQVRARAMQKHSKALIQEMGKVSPELWAANCLYRELPWDGKPGCVERDAGAWKRLMSDVEAISRFAEHIASRRLSPGRAIPDHLISWGLRVRDRAIALKVKDSAAQRSQMVRIFTILFDELGVDRDPREFVRALHRYE